MENRGVYFGSALRKCLRIDVARGLEGDARVKPRGGVGTSSQVDDDGYKGACQSSFSSATGENPSGDYASCLRLSSHHQKARRNFGSAISRLESNSAAIFVRVATSPELRASLSLDVIA